MLLAALPSDRRTFFHAAVLLSSPSLCRTPAHPDFPAVYRILALLCFLPMIVCANWGEAS
jgi:hypothetical protein